MERADDRRDSGVSGTESCYRRIYADGINSLSGQEMIMLQPCSWDEISYFHSCFCGHTERAHSNSHQTQRIPTIPSRTVTHTHTHTYTHKTKIAHSKNHIEWGNYFIVAVAVVHRWRIAIFTVFIITKLFEIISLLLSLSHSKWKILWPKKSWCPHLVTKCLLYVRMFLCFKSQKANHNCGNIVLLGWLAWKISNNTFKSFLWTRVNESEQWFFHQHTNASATPIHYNLMCVLHSHSESFAFTIAFILSLYIGVPFMSTYDTHYDAIVFPNWKVTIEHTLNRIHERFI